MMIKKEQRKKILTGKKKEAVGYNESFPEIGFILN